MVNHFLHHIILTLFAVEKIIKMKKITILLMLVMVAIPDLAQHPIGSHTYRIDDRIVKQQVALSPDGECRQDMVWDLRDMEELNNGRKVCYTEVYDKPLQVAGIENSTRHYYEQRGDSLLAWGYENNLTRAEYDRPILLLHTPLVYGSRHEGQFHGTEAYCEKVFSRLFGSYEVTVDGTGMMLLPSGDTLRHVSRVHVRERTAIRHYPHVGTVQELKNYVDSIVYTADSIRMQMAQEPLTVTDTYRWYAEGYRYPIIEVVTTDGGDDGDTAYTAYYTAPEEELSLDDEENKTVREQLAILDSQGEGGDTTEQATHPSAMSRHDITVNGQTVTIDYDLTEGATVKGLVCNVMGMVFRQRSQHHEAGEHYQMQLNCSGLRRGEYVLYLNVNGQVTSSTVSL